MLNRAGVAAFLLTCALLVRATPLYAQESGAAQTQKPSLRIHTTAEIVLTDVVVTGRKGHPVQGLTASDFHIYDDGKPQKILSFQENRTEKVTGLCRAYLRRRMFTPMRSSIICHRF